MTLARPILKRMIAIIPPRHDAEPTFCPTTTSRRCWSEFPGGGSKVLDCCDQQLPDLTRDGFQVGIVDGDHRRYRIDRADLHAPFHRPQDHIAGTLADTRGSMPIAM